MSVGNVPEGELWDIAEFGDFKIRLVNGDGMGEIIDFGEWVERHKEYGSK